MANQFTVYSSSDSGAPTLTGVSGSLLTILDACLINGYGAKPAAGWIKAFPTTSSYACYQLATGSGLFLFVYDGGSGSAAGAEAQLTGFGNVTSITNGLVTGSGPFPSNTQLSIGFGANAPTAYGAVIARKSNVATAAARNWKIYADNLTMYAFIQTNDYGNGYYAFSFGDFFSLKSGSIDTGRCMIVGRPVASSSVNTNESLDFLSSIFSGVTGNYAQLSYNALGTSSFLGKHGDGVKGDTLRLRGNIPFMNPVDASLYMSPIWITEFPNGYIRGMMRGFYQICHTTTSFTDTQIFTGSGQYSNYSFQLVQPSGNLGTYLLETSATLINN